MVLQSIDLREEILKEFHYSHFVVHSGGTKMYHDLRRQYYGSGMKQQVGDCVRQCLTCQQVKAEHQRPARLLQPLEVAEWKWEHVTMNFVTHLPQTLRGHDAMWVIVDRLTKSAHFLVVQMTFTSRGILQVIHMTDYPVTWSVSLYSIRPGFQVYSSFLGELPTSHGDTIDVKHCFSSPDGRSIRENHLDVRGHAMGMCPYS